ncbi:Kelch repeat-containing protein [Sorangium sp. So ce233]|uniref:Kelch repeat-containing protein n=1 Tax=Sorangium sp. So ce233 TaxID=3133290 RepID=UPI003F5FB51F
MHLQRRWLPVAMLLPAMEASGCSGGDGDAAPPELASAAPRVGARGEALRTHPIWAPAGSMISGRHLHTATLLADGKVLVTGGRGADTDWRYWASAELYSPATRTWTPAASMSAVRFEHAAARLQSGKVLVTGGRDALEHAQASAELYDPATDTWTPVSPMVLARHGHTATQLLNGKVLVVGGGNGTELYDPATDTWTIHYATGVGRNLHTVTVLRDGKLLVMDDGFYPRLYDPVTNTWRTGDRLDAPREGHAAALLPSGKVLVTGGINQRTGGYFSSALLFDPVADAWTDAGSMSEGRSWHTATRLPGGKVLVVGGYDGLEEEGSEALARTDLYDPAANAWTDAGSMSTTAYWHTATLLSTGQVLVAGGSSYEAVRTWPTAEVYTPGPMGSP